MTAPGSWGDEIEPGRVLWVLGMEDRVPRKVPTMLVGNHDIGKTTLLIWMIGQVVAAGGSVWLNSKEDDTSTVLRPRLDVAGVDVRRVRLSNEAYVLPRDLNRWAESAAAGDERTGGRPYDLIALDSFQRHVPAFQRAEVVLEVMDALWRVAHELAIGVVVVNHLKQAKGSSVEAAIAGPQALQDQAKAIFLLGPEPKGEHERLRRLLEGPSDDKPDTLVLACQRIDVGPKPESLAFVREIVYHPVTDRGEPMLRLAGPSPATAGQVLEAIKAETREPTQDETAAARCALWVVEGLLEGPIRSAELVERAKGAGFSPRTLERARKLAQAKPFKKNSEWWVSSGWTGAPLPNTAKDAKNATASNEAALEIANEEHAAGMAGMATLPGVGDVVRITGMPGTFRVKAVADTSFDAMEIEGGEEHTFRPEQIAEVVYRENPSSGES